MPTASERADIRAATEEIKQLTRNVVVDATLEASRQLYDKTPKDSTWTASNWNPSIGIADGTVRGLRKARQNRELKGAFIISTYSLNQGKTFISSGLRHIESLNASGSARLGVPAAFTQRAVIGTVKTVDKTA